MTHVQLHVFPLYMSVFSRIRLMDITQVRFGGFILWSMTAAEFDQDQECRLAVGQAFNLEYVARFPMKALTGPTISKIPPSYMCKTYDMHPKSCQHFLSIQM